MLFLIAVVLSFFYFTPKVMGLFNPYKSTSAVFNPSSIGGVTGSPFSIMNYVKKFNAIISNFMACFSCKFNYFYVMSLSLFPALLSPSWVLPALPYVIFASLSSYSAYYSVPYQYGMYFVPMLFVAYVFGLSKVKARFRMAVISLLLAVFTFVFFSTLSPFAQPNFYGFLPSLQSAGLKYAYLVMSLVPKNASILTINNLFPRFANDINAYVVPYGLPLSYTLTHFNNTDYILVDSTGYIWGAQYGVIKALTQGYGLYAETDGFYLFRKGYSSDPIINIPLNITLPATSFYIWSGTPVKVVSIKNRAAYYWPSNASGSVFWFGPYLILMPGNYEAIVYLMITSKCNGTILTLGVANNGGTQILANRVISCNDFQTANTWVGFTLNFTITEPALYVEIRGLHPTGVTGVYFGGVKLVETQDYG